MYKKTGYPVGRPPKIKNAKQLQKLFAEYLEYCKEEHKYVSLSGFCVYFGSSRWYLDGLIERDAKEFTNTIKAIKETIARITIEHAQNSEKNQALNIFLLKNYGYTDKTEQDLNIKGNVSISKLFDGMDDKQDK